MREPERLDALRANPQLLYDLSPREFEEVVAELRHVLSIGVVVSLLWLAQAALPDKVLRYSAAAVLFGFGCYRLVRSRHPAWVGMRVGFRDPTLWSFLMASAHGAGLMLVPIIIG